MDFMIPYGVLLYQSSAKSLRCLPMKSNFLLEIPPESGSARLGHIPSLPGKPQLPLKPCISLQPFHFKRQLRFLRFSLRFQCVLINTSVKEGSLPSLTNHLAELSQLDRSSPAAVMRLLRLLNEWLVSAKSDQ